MSIRSIKGQSGSSIVLFLIVGSMVAIFVASLAATAFSVIKVKSQKNSRSAMSEIIDNSRMCILEGLSWAATARDSANSSVLSCLTDRQGCTDGASGIIRLEQAGGKSFCLNGYDSLNPKAGFSINGEVCYGFDSKGNDACPYRIEYQWFADCPSNESVNSASCANPAETVVMSILFKPGQRSKFVRFNLSDGIDRSRYAQPMTIAITRNSSNRLAAAKRYGADTSVAVLALRNQLLSSSNVRLPVTLLEKKIVGSPGGACLAGGLVRRQVNFIQSDPGLLVVSPIESSEGYFVLRHGFTYECEISVPGFLTGTFFGVLRKVDSGEIVIRGNTAYSSGALGFAQVRSWGSGSFTLTQDTKFEIDQYCSQAPSSLASILLGVPFGAAEEDYTYLRCKSVPWS